MFNSQHIYSFSQIQISQTGGQPYCDTSFYKVSECSLIRQCQSVKFLTFSLAPEKTSLTHRSIDQSITVSSSSKLNNSAHRRTQFSLSLSLSASTVFEWHRACDVTQDTWRLPTSHVTNVTVILLSMVYHVVLVTSALSYVTSFVTPVTLPIMYVSSMCHI